MFTLFRSKNRPTRLHPKRSHQRTTRRMTFETLAARELMATDLHFFAAAMPADEQSYVAKIDSLDTTEAPVAFETRNVLGLDMDRANNVLYGGRSRLHRMDPVTNQSVDVGSFQDESGSSILIDSLTVSPTGELFGLAQKRLFTIDTATAEVHYVGAIDIANTEDIFAIEFDDRGQLYAAGDRLLIINPESAATESNAGDLNHSVGELDFAEDGNLYATLAGGDRSDIVRINPATAAQESLALYPVDLRGLASFHFDAGPPTPAIDAIEEPATIVEDAEWQTIDFTGVSPGANDSQSLRVTATSSNVALIPHPTVSYVNGKTSGQLSYKPVANASGVAFVTVAVLDPGDDGEFDTADDGVASETFRVRVAPVNDLPTIEGVDDIRLTDWKNAVDTFVVGDVETATQDLIVSASSDNQNLLSNDNITLSGVGSSRTVSVVPTFGESGVANVTLTVKDADGGERSASMVVEVSPPLARTWHNGDYPEDVDGNGRVTLIDPFIVIDNLRTHGLGVLPSTPDFAAPFIDINNNGRVDLQDPFIVIQEVRRLFGGKGSGEGEGTDSIPTSSRRTGQVVALDAPSPDAILLPMTRTTESKLEYLSNNTLVGDEDFEVVLDLLTAERTT